jgi:hypothetical protein
MPEPRTCTKCDASGLMPFRANGFASIITGLTIFSAVPVVRYVCTTCGFVEDWVEGKANLEKLRQARTKAR